MFIFDGYDDN